MRVAELNLSPVKSTRLRPVDEAAVEPWGLRHDRRWMVVDVDGFVVTARVVPALLTVTATALGVGRARLTGPHAGDVDVDAAGCDDLLPVQVWRSKLDAVHPGGDADDWLSELLGQNVRLVWLDDPSRRPVDPEYGRADDCVSFADAYPLMVTTTASLRQLGDWVVEEALLRGETPPSEPLAMRRFRPNVVVDGSSPFEEDTWHRIRIGDVPFRAVKLCDRCVLTTIDPDTLSRGKEPLRTLARHRRWDGKVWFGLNLVPDGTGAVRVGDEVEILAG